MTRLLRKGSGNAQWVLAAAAASLMLAAGSARADVTACRNKLQTEVDKLQDAISAAMSTCKARIGGELAKGVLSGLGTNCAPGGGCLAAAAQACEAALLPVYDTDHTASSPSKVAVFRKNIEATRQGTCIADGSPCNANAQCPAVPGQNACTAVCTDEDIAVKITRDGTSLGHMLSGAQGYAPPASGSCDLDGDGKADPNCAAKFMIDHLLFATESLTIKQQLMTDPDTLALFQDAVGAAYGGSASSKATSCSAPTDPTTQAFRPNLCRFGLECKSHSCQIDTTGVCDDDSTCDTRGTDGLCNFDSPPCQTNDPHACNNQPIVCYPNACGGSGCQPNHSYVSLSTAFGLQLTIPVLGGFNVEACEASSLTGEGSAFNAEPNFLYLINQPDKALTALVPAGLAGLIPGVCLQIVRSEGWCDCSGVGLPKDFLQCQDHVTSGSGTDACNLPIDPANLDPTYPGTVDGVPLLTPSGSSAAGDCVDLVSMQFSFIIDLSELGPDGVPCTEDDLTIPAPPFSVVLTTGTSSVQMFDTVHKEGRCGRSGHCTGSLAPACDASLPGTCLSGSCYRDTCVQDINCRQTGIATDTCNSPAPGLVPFNLSLSGAKTTCDNYRASNFGGFAIAGAVGIPDGKVDYLPIPDMVTAFRFACK